jgi:hypothetical protein
MISSRGTRVPDASIGVWLPKNVSMPVSGSLRNGRAALHCESMLREKISFEKCMATKTNL